MIIRKILNKIFYLSMNLSIWVFFFAGIIAIYFSDNIKGYYKFKHLCETEAGSMVYGKLESNVGWEVETRGLRRVPVFFKEVAFVRFPDRRNELYEIRYKSGPREERKSYFVDEANILLTTKYRFSQQRTQIDEKLLVGKRIAKIIDIETKQTMYEFIGFDYSMFNRHKTFLGAPSGRTCNEFNFKKIGELFK